MRVFPSHELKCQACLQAFSNGRTCLQAFSNGRACLQAFSHSRSHAPKTQQYGPKFVRHQLIKLEALCSQGNLTGWREADQCRVDALTALFLAGSYGLGVACCVQILDKEDPHGQKLIDDGVSTVAALKMCEQEFQKNSDATPSGEIWSESLAAVFRVGLNVRVVAYTDNDDRESREAWNTAKHDEESNTVRWSTLHQKLETAATRHRKLGDWTKASSSLLDLYGPGKRATVGRWVRAAKGMHPTVRDALKQYPDLKGAYLWDNTYLISNPSAARNQLSPDYAVKALKLLDERLTMEPMSGERFQNEICKPMKIVEVWQSLMKKRYGSVATGSAALDRLVGTLVQWGGLQSVSRCAQSGVVLHGTSTENQGIAECHLLVKEFDKCQAGGLPPPSRIPTEQEARQQAEEDKKQAEAKKQAEEEAKKHAEELERLGQEKAHASSLTDETDLLMLTSPAPPLSEAGVSAAHSQNPQAEASRNRLLAITAQCDAIVNRVTFCDTFDELLAKSKERLQNTSRSFIWWRLRRHTSVIFRSCSTLRSRLAMRT